MEPGISKPETILFLSWGSPWPALGGGTLRTLGLLRQLSRSFRIRLIILGIKPLSVEQRRELEKYVESIIVVPAAGNTLVDRVLLFGWYILGHLLPYHCALLHLSFARVPRILQQIRSFPGVVYASFGHWGTLAENGSGNWILDQHNADVDFWRVYASQANRFPAKIAALINWCLAKKHFPKIYSRVGRIISVCQEDRKLTLQIVPGTVVDVIENGVDCSFFRPNRNRPHKPKPFRLLFTGTSAPRNLTALHQFVRNIYPFVKQELSDCELLVAGDFSKKAQAEFFDVPGIRFTGKVDDIRPYFNESDIYISPFQETHGSKLKIAEAMAMAMPIVSTPQGIRGFKLKDGESVLLSENNREFARQIVRLSEDSRLRERIRQNARKVALKTVDWNFLGEKLILIVKEHLNSL